MQEPPDGGDALARHPGYVLVVSPDERVRETLESMLVHAAFDVMCASEAEVVAACDLQPPRLVVIDVPGAVATRYKPLQRLATHPPLANAPLLVLAPDRDVEGFRAAVVQGAAACLPMPVDAGTLSAVAARLLEWSPPPPEVDSRRRRRRALLLDVEVTERDTGRHVSGQITEASSGGCRLDLPLLLEPGAKVRIVVRAHDQVTRIALGGEVRWAQQRDDGRGAAGVCFNESTSLVAARELGLTEEQD